MLSINKIYNEECISGMKKIEDNSVDMILCDLPYGTTNCSWDSVIPFKELWEQYKRVIKDDGAVVLFGAEPFSTVLRYSNLKDYKYDWYWEKNAPTGFVFSKYQPMRDIETISVFYAKKANYFPQGIIRVKKPKVKKTSMREDGIYNKESLGKSHISEFTGYPKNVLKFRPDRETSFHPTQKPVALCEYLIKTYTKKNELILDNCMGSGTTAIACLNTDRKFIGFELNKQYYDKSLERVKNNVTQLELL